MTKQPLPRFRADVAVVVELSAVDEEDARRRLEAIEDFILQRLGKTTFSRLEGKPVVEHIESYQPSAA